MRCLCAQGTAAVASVLASNHSLYSLSLAGCPVRDEGAMALAEALKTNIALYRLDLSRCQVSCTALSPACSSNSRSSSTTLHACCPAAPQIGPEGAIALAAALKVNTVLSCLNMSGTLIGVDAGREALCVAVMLQLIGSSCANNCNTACLHASPLPHCTTCAGSAGCEALCKALRSAGSSGIKELDLSHTSIDDRAAVALASLLAGSKVLERLLLSDTQITDAGAQLMCNALQVGAGIFGVRYSGLHAQRRCKHGSPRLAAAARCTQNNNTLQFIDVSSSSYMDKSWQKLLNHVVKGKPRA